MKKRVIFKGVATALITPMRDGEIDYAALLSLIDLQIQNGVEALVLGGTTAEVATLSDEERYTLYARCVDHIAGRVCVILGVGTNDTKKTLAHTRYASSLCAEGVLAVTPYYNKGTDDGLIAHYRRIADASRLPVILYNVPGRTGVCLREEQIRLLAEHENIVAIKEACDSADRLVALAALGEQLTLYAGNDTQTYTVMALGGAGVISVLSNLLPRRMCEICELYREGRHAESRKAQLALTPLMHTMFCETNPAPIKYAMEVCGMCRAEVRLPLAVPAPPHRQLIRQALSQEGLCT